MADRQVDTSRLLHRVSSTDVRMDGNRGAHSDDNGDDKHMGDKRRHKSALT
jgi:hypothetical protein